MKSKNNTTKKKEPTKNRTNADLKHSPWIEDYYDCFSLKLKPVTMAFIERLSFELNEWSKKDDSLILGRFYSDKDIPKESFYRWKDKYPQFNSAYKSALQRIALRKEEGIMLRKLEGNFTYKTLCKNDEESWRDYKKWEADISKPADDEREYIVNVNDITSQRKKDEGG